MTSCVIARSSLMPNCGKWIKEMHLNINWPANTPQSVYFPQQHTELSKLVNVSVTSSVRDTVQYSLSQCWDPFYTLLWKEKNKRGHSHTGKKPEGQRMRMKWMVEGSLHLSTEICFCLQHITAGRESFPPSKQKQTHTLCFILYIFTRGHRDQGEDEHIHGKSNGL